MTETETPTGATIDPPQTAASGEAKVEKTPGVKTGYIILRVQDRKPVDAIAEVTEGEGFQPGTENPGPKTWFPLLEILNAPDVNGDGQPIPVEAYSREQAVKILVDEQFPNGEPMSQGNFIAVPVRSFTPINRAITQITDTKVGPGKL